MVLFSMQAHDFIEDFLFHSRQIHFSEASSVRFRHVHEKFVAFFDVASDRWTLDGASDLIALIRFPDVFAVAGPQGFHLADL